MTRTKTNKLVAILMAILMAFAFMSFSLTYVSAEDNGTASSDTASSDTASSDTGSSDTASSDNSAQQLKADESTTKEAPTPTISITTYTYGAPDINVTIDFGDATPKLDYTKTTDTDFMKTLTENIKVYSDKELTKQVNYTGAKYSNLKYDNKKVTFTVPLNKSNLSATTTYYLFLGKALNETTEVEGADSFFEFKTNATTTSTRSTSYRTTYKTVSTTNRTVKAKSANTDDPSHLPVWIALAAVSALMLGAAYISKEKE